MVQDSSTTTKPSWKILQVWRRKGPDLVGEERLYALVHWLRGETSPEDQFFDPESKNVLTDPMAVSWARFPLQDAMDATPAKVDEDAAPRHRRARNPRGSARDTSGRSASENLEPSSSTFPSSTGAPDYSDQLVGGE